MDIKEKINWDGHTSKMVSRIFIDEVKAAHADDFPDENLAQTLAKLVDKTPVAVYKWLNGQHTIKLCIAFRIALFYNLDLNAILDEVERRQKEVDNLPL